MVREETWTARSLSPGPDCSPAHVVKHSRSFGLRSKSPIGHSSGLFLLAVICVSCHDCGAVFFELYVGHADAGVEGKVLGAWRTDAMRLLFFVRAILATKYRAKLMDRRCKGLAR